MNAQRPHLFLSLLILSRQSLRVSTALNTQSRSHSMVLRKQQGDERDISLRHAASGKNPHGPVSNPSPGLLFFYFFRLSPWRDCGVILSFTARDPEPQLDRWDLLQSLWRKWSVLGRLSCRRHRYMRTNSFHFSLPGPLIQSQSSSMNHPEHRSETSHLVWSRSNYA